MELTISKINTRNLTSTKSVELLSTRGTRFTCCESNEPGYGYAVSFKPMVQGGRTIQCRTLEGVRDVLRLY